MRLEILERAHRRRAKAFLRLAAKLFGDEVDDVVKTALHRPEFFGRTFFGLLTEVLRGPSYWTVGEREYMAMFTSRLNECPFCVRAHTETTRIETRGEVDADGGVHRTELAAVLALLEKVTRAPGDLSREDVDEVRGAGVPDEAIVDALHVNLIFNTVNRLANGFGWAWDSDDQVRAGAKIIHRTGYRLPGFVLR